jgi:hypothetical protein
VTSGLWGLSEKSPAVGLFDYDGLLAQAVDRWMCVETTVSFGARTSVQVAVDGIPAISVALADPSAFYNVVEVGAARADAPGLRVYVDDVVVATQHIGCE